jgi:HSP20 family molecular chaperone IbpA
MSHVTICKCNSSEATPPTLLERMEAVTDSIRKRAFQIFQRRQNGGGSDLDDWLQAERDVVLSPPSELVEDEKKFTASIALPGFDAKDIEVSALPDAIVVQAAATHTDEEKEGDVRFSEFSGKQLFRRVDLPAPVDVDKVTASVDKGILRITAPKVTRQMTVAA